MVSELTRLNESTLWWRGPDFLSKHESEWPKVKIAEGLEVKTESKTKFISAPSVNFVVRRGSEDCKWRLPPSNWSSWLNLTRVVAWTLRFVANCRSHRQAEFLLYDMRFPVILPRGSWTTKLIVKHHHEAGHHITGTNHTLSNLSTKYWIPVVREEIRQWEKECNECKRCKAKAAQQIMAPLPRVHLQLPL